MYSNPDKEILFSAGPVHLNTTILCTWIVMAVLVLTSAAVTSRMKKGKKVTAWQGILETAYEFIYGQVQGVMGFDPKPFIPFLGTLGLFILSSNLMEVVPLFHPPTGSLSTTAALAVCVFFAVPAFAVRKKGLWGHLKSYITPTPLMIPFHIISEISRTVSLAVRLFGNIMSENMIGAVFLAILPLFFPIVMQAFGMIIGTVQAYIFFTLASVYIGSAQSAQH